VKTCSQVKMISLCERDPRNLIWHLRQKFTNFFSSTKFFLFFNPKQPKNSSVDVDCRLRKEWNDSIFDLSF
jgi:hypothetical protein